ncbi:ATP-binding protein [Tumebacillus sp. ITR2]|uniref:ATP-binding protein n=1 Tax=Tumebacillus amylolyticus TaxID=2801339 RepID=A0ABS1J684_9BACL|nr:ATP-binding protein [Tumebacillus amylolyticus]MBL0385732.1 ATP-binding protein [Tumebacillus amylolyticus]
MSQMVNSKLTRKAANAIIQSMGGGVVPQEGIEHVVVGRVREIRQLVEDLNLTADGLSCMKFLIGDYGTGKSFMATLTRYIAYRENFVVAYTDLTANRRLYAHDGKAVATYSDLIQNLSTKSKPNGNALRSLIERWLSDLQQKVAVEQEFDGVPDATDARFTRLVTAEVQKVIHEIQELSGGFDFATVLGKYYQGYLSGDEQAQEYSIKWLRGEYRTKTEARADLGVREIINDDNWFDYVKVLTKFITSIGYRGLLVLFDEAINLYKIDHPQARSKNYERVLEFYNECTQGRATNLMLMFMGTTDFLEDERRGLFSYKALKSRLQTNQYETEQFRDLRQPVIKLAPLSAEELYVLLQKMRDVYAALYQVDDITRLVTDDNILEIVQKALARPGGVQFITPRELIREFIGILNLLHQNPEMDRGTIFQERLELAQAETRRFTGRMLE